MNKWQGLLFSIVTYGCAIAGAQEQDSEIIAVGTDKFLRWHGHEGRTYFLQVADPNELLRKWLWAPVIETGNGEAISYEVNSTADTAFFRLLYTDQPTTDPEGDDFDDDGLSNWLEISEYQTSPLLPDTDGDGLPDPWEIAHGINPLDNGATNILNGAGGQFKQSGLTNAQAYAAGVMAHPSASITDHDGDGLDNHEDADPKQRLIDWKRLPNVTYAVVDLNMQELEIFFPPHGRLPVLSVLNDHGAICREPNLNQQENTPTTWDGMNYPVVWENLQDYSTELEQSLSFDYDFHVAFNNQGNVFHGLFIDNGFNGVPGIQSVTFQWNDNNSAPVMYGDYPHEVDMHRTLNSRFSQLAVQQTQSHYPRTEPASWNRKIIAGTFTRDVTAEDTDELPSLQSFNFYSHAPHITRTGKVLIRENDISKVNDVPVPAGSIYGLCADPHDRDLIALLNSAVSSNIHTMRYREGVWETMPMPGIMDMNASGTAITFPEHQLWVNGETIELDELLEQSGWTQFKAEQINKHGLILGSAMPDGGEAHKAVLLVPINFDVYPPEPSDEEISAAGEDNWEVETFQIPADDPEFWIQANIMVPGKDEDGNPVMVPAEDGTEITWEIDEDVSDSGATLSSSTSVTENGHTAVKLTTSTVPRDRFKVTAKLTKLKWKTGKNYQIATYEDTDGFHTVKTQFFEVVPGNVSYIAVTADASSLPADQKSEVVIQAVLTDDEGNPAARGTDVTWHVSGGGRIKERDHLISEENGTVTATLISGSVVGEQKITVEADGVVGEITIANTAVQIVSLTSSESTLDIANKQSATITLQTIGVADGAEVTWKTSLGTIIGKTSAVENNTAQAVLLADAGVIGNSVVWATVGDAIKHCDVAFISSAIASLEVAQPVLVYDETTDGMGTVPKLGGGTENIPYHTTSQVSIRSPGNPGAWATVGFTGSIGSPGFSFPFEQENNALTPTSPAATNATLANGAFIDTAERRTANASLSLPDGSAKATIPHDGSLSLLDGSILRFSLRPTDSHGVLLNKQGEYSATILEDGKLKFTLGTGQNATEVTSAASLTSDTWHDVRITLSSGHLLMEISGTLASSPLVSVPPANTNDLLLGGCALHLDDLSFVHQQTGLQGIQIIATGLNAQNEVQLDQNGEAVIQLRPQMLGQGPPPEVLAQNVNVQVQVANANVNAKNALTVTNKGTAVLIQAIGGKTSYVGTDVTSATDRARLISGQLRAAINVADRTGAIPDDMGADAVARGEAGYLIAIWMEETVDEAGIVHPVMQVSAQNLPPEIAEVLNWLLAELMVSAGQRDSSEGFNDYIWKNKKELLLALQALSKGDEEQFLTIAGVIDGEEGAENAAAVAQQVGQGVIQAMAKSGLSSLGRGYDALRAWVGKQNWGIELRERHEAGEAARKLQKSVIEAVAGTAGNCKNVIKNCSEYLLQEQLIDPEGAAALGFAYGVVEKIDELGQDVAQPDLLAQSAMQLADLTVSAVGGDEQAKEALKEIGSIAVMTPINAIPESKAHWDQGNYFQAGAGAVAVVEVALVAKFVKDLAVKSTRKALRWGRHKTTDWQATHADIGLKAEALAFQRLKKKGFRDIVPIRNASNHGIDWVCRDKKRRYCFH